MSTHVEKIETVVVFYANVPNDELEADTYADQLSDAITASVEQLSLNYGVIQGSVEVADWTGTKP